ncbi:MAG: hypothetical protein LBW85_06425 [Deltaproteobacteria bacterium]|jgi:2'-5' RNA ligase|nr:hypothetical protein [Deltaproteobacteria bacterium]
MEPTAPQTTAKPLKTRLFVGFPAASAVLPRLAYLADKAPELQGLVMRNPHVNVRFIGEVDPGAVPGIREALKAASACGPFALSLKGLFVHRGKKAHFLCVRVENPAPLTAVKEAVDAALLPVEGIPTRPVKFYRPSLLVKTFKAPPGADLLSLTCKCRNMSFGTFHVDGLTLFQSRLEPSGSIHTVIDSYKFLGPPADPKRRCEARRKDFAPRKPFRAPRPVQGGAQASGRQTSAAARAAGFLASGSPAPTPSSGAPGASAAGREAEAGKACPDNASGVTAVTSQPPPAPAAVASQAPAAPAAVASQAPAAPAAVASQSPAAPAAGASQSPPAPAAGASQAPAERSDAAGAPPGPAGGEPGVPAGDQGSGPLQPSPRRKKTPKQPSKAGKPKNQKKKKGGGRRR